jgi:hypothetical protein
MGMFDSIYINVKCPFCGNESKMECQTKELECDLSVFEKGDFIGNSNIQKLEDCITDCHSKECVDFTNKEDGYVSGFGRVFRLDLLLNNGVITGEYENVKSWC